MLGLCVFGPLLLGCDGLRQWILLRRGGLRCLVGVLLGGLVGEFLLVVSNLLIRVLVLGLSGRKLKRIQ